jgi:hypothetical protein
MQGTDLRTNLYILAKGMQVAFGTTCSCGLSSSLLDLEEEEEVEEAVRTIYQLDCREQEPYMNCSPL